MLRWITLKQNKTTTTTKTCHAVVQSRAVSVHMTRVTFGAVRLRQVFL